MTSGYLLKDDVEELIGRIVLVHSLPEALEKSQVIVESVFEDLQVKRELFNQMVEICKQRAVPPASVLLCSNTMSLSIDDITRDVCKEYLGSCVGMRFLQPVWFIDEVELTECERTRRGSSATAERILQRLFFDPFHFDGSNRRRLTLQEIATYQSLQRLRCPQPMQASFFRRSNVSSGLRKKRLLSSGHLVSSLEKSELELPAGSAQFEPAGEQSPGSSSSDCGVCCSASPPSPPEDLEPCAVCLEAPRTALLVPCGHTATCVECAHKVMHSSHAVCVVCRTPIEKVLRAVPP